MVISKRTLSESQIVNELGEAKSFVVKRIVKRTMAIHACVNQNVSSADEIVAEYFNKSALLNDIEKQSIFGSAAEESLSIIKAILKLITKSKLSCEEQLGAFGRLNNDTGDSVLLMSINKAKGLGWPVVILPGMCESVMPYQHPGTKLDIESERRLAFVGLTRAKSQLVIIAPHDESFISSMSEGRSLLPASHSVEPVHASRFLYEANLSACMTLGTALHNNTKPNDFKSDSAKVMNSYLAAINSEIRVPEYE